MITEDYVSYEVAKLLKEKGFDGECRTVYKSNGCIHDNVRYEGKWLTNSLLFPSEYSAPTHQMAMQWLRGKGIEFETRVDFDCMSEPPTYAFVGYSARIYTIEKAINVDEIHIDRYETYKEAVDAALKYSLENLV